jgi:flagellar motor switch protein FliM
MSEVLSQDEIDQLLRAIAAGEVEAPEEHTPSDQDRIKCYDFKSPDVFGSGDLRFMDGLLTRFALLVSNALSDMAHAAVTVSLSGIDQSPWRDRVRDLPDSFTLAVIDLDPLKGPAVLVIDPLFRSLLLDLLLGGKGGQLPSFRQHTDIEQSIVEGIVLRMLGPLREALSTAVDVHPRLGAVGAGPRRIPNLPLDQMMAEIVFEYRAGKVEGLIELYIFASALFPILPRLRNRLRQGRFGTSGREACGSETSVSSDRPTTVELATAGEQLPLKALGRLRRGQRIRLPGLERRELELRADGLTIARLRQDREGPLLVLKTCLTGGAEAAAEAITQPEPSLARTPPPADEVPAFSAPSVPHARPFDFVTRSQIRRFADLLSMELPQTAAAVLAAMEPTKAAQVLDAIPGETRVELLSRIGTIGFVDPDVVREVERVIEMLLAVPTPSTPG